MMHEANKHLQAGELDEAEALYRDEIEANPQNAEAMFMLAQVRQKAGDLDEALTLLEGAERLEPFNPNIFHARGALHIHRNETEAAVRAFQLALEINPSHAAARNGLAFVELARGRLEAAEHAADRVLSDEPANVQALTYKGTALLELGKSREAIAYLQEALRIEPEATTAQAQLGRAFLAEGNNAFAVQCFENALQRAPGSADLLEYLGRAQLEMGEAKQALKPLREAFGKGRANPELFRALAECETAAGRPGQGEGLLRAALQMGEEGQPPRTDLVVPLAELIIARGHGEEAVSLLKPVQETGVDDEMLDIILSRAYVVAGDTEAAIAAIRPRAEREAARSQVAGDAPDIARLALVEVLEAAGETDQAQAQLEGLLAAENPSLDVLFYRAQAAQRAGDPAAIEWLQEIVNRPGLTTRRLFSTRSLLARALHQAGRFPEAAGQFEALAHRDAEVLYVDADFAGSEIDASSAMQVGVTTDWPSEPLGDNDPIFIIAWPGSGQERLLPALQAHSGLQLVLDSSSSQSSRRAHIDRPRGADALTRFDSTQIQLRRSRYWKALGKVGTGDAGSDGSPRVIDGMWLSVEALPTISRIFPGATVLVLGRDPRDMCVAWMMSGYRNLGPMTLSYKRQLTLLDQCRKVLPLNFINLDYDEVEDDPDTALVTLQEALGLTPEVAVLERFQETSLSVPISRGAYRNYVAPDTSGESGAADSDAIH